MYTKGQLTEFWDNILMSSASKNALQKFTRKLIVPSQSKKGHKGYTYYAPKMDFFVDNMISPGYFESEFRQIFGTIGYWLEKCGNWFAVFFFIKLIIDVTVTIVEHSRYTDLLEHLLDSVKIYSLQLTICSWFQFSIQCSAPLQKIFQ